MLTKIVHRARDCMEIIAGVAYNTLMDPCSSNIEEVGTPVTVTHAALTPMTIELINVKKLQFIQVLTATCIE